MNGFFSFAMNLMLYLLAILGIFTPRAAFLCPQEGSFENEEDISTYYNCTLDNGSVSSVLEKCPEDLKFDSDAKKCVPEFACTAEGRYLNSYDPKCKSYFVCSTNENGTFSRAKYKCPENTSFDPRSSQCSTSYVCEQSEEEDDDDDDGDDSSAIRRLDFVCTEKGRFADLTDLKCKQYFLCSQLSNGSFIKTSYKCPISSNFDQSLGKCSASYDCFASTGVPETTTAIPEYICTVKGRFPDLTDTTCKKYFLCSKLSNGSFIKTVYNCPATSNFNPRLKKCSANYLCHPTTTQNPTELITTTEELKPANTSFTCTAHGRFPDPTDQNCTSYFLCLQLKNGTFIQTPYSCPPKSKFDPSLGECSATFQCGFSTTSKPTFTTEMLGFICTDKGRFPDSQDDTCKRYYLCSFLSNGTFIKTVYNCPSTSAFDPSLGKCSKSFVCSNFGTTNNYVTQGDNASSSVALPSTQDKESSSAATITNPPRQTTLQDRFYCVQNGRFADASDDTCKKYYLCKKLVNGTFIKYSYECPNTSAFDPSLGKCSSSYECGIPTSTRLATVTPSSSATKTSWSSTTIGYTNSSTIVSEKTNTSPPEGEPATTTIAENATSLSNSSSFQTTVQNNPTLENSTTFATDRTFSSKMSSLDPSLFTTNHEPGNRSDVTTGATSFKTTTSSENIFTRATGPEESSLPNNRSDLPTTNSHIATEVSTNIEHLSTVVTGSEQTMVTPKQEFICTRIGPFPDDSDETCSRYFLCWKWHNEEFIKTPFKCPGLSIFDPTLGRCSKSYICPWSKTTSATNQSHTTQETMLSTISTVLLAETSTSLDENGSTNSNSLTNSESDHSTLSTKLEEEGFTLLEEEGETSDSKVSTEFIKESSTMSTGLEKEESTILEERGTTNSSDRPATEIVSTIKSEPTLENYTTFATDRTYSSKMSSLDPSLFTTNHEPDNRSDLTTGATSFKTTTSSENVFTIATGPEESSLPNNRSDLPTTTSPYITTEVSTNIEHLSTVVTGSEQTMVTPKQEFICTRTGRFPDDSDETCSRYFLCSKLHNDEFIKTSYKCPGFSTFDPSLGRCSKSYICPWSKTTSATNQSHTTQETMLLTTSTVLVVETSTLLDRNGSTNSNSPTTKSESDHSTLSTNLEEDGSTLLEEEGETSDSKISTAFNKEVSTMSTGLENEASTILEEQGTTNSSDRPATEIVSTLKSETSIPSETSGAKFYTSTESETATSTENEQKISKDFTSKETSNSTEFSFITSSVTESAKKSTNFQATKGTSEPSSSTSTVSKTTLKITTTTIGHEFVCTISGRFPDYTDTTCKRYFLCLQMPNGDFTKTLYYCPGISSFDPQSQKCTDSFVCPRFTTKDTEITESGKITPEYTEINEDTKTAGTLVADYSTTALQEEQSTSLNEKKTTTSPQDSTVSTQFNEEQTALSEGGSTVTSIENSTTKIEETTLSSQISNEISTSSEDARNSSPTTSESSMISTIFEEKDTTQFGNDETTNTHKNSKTEINDNPSTVPTFTSTEEKGATNVSDSSSTKTENDYSSLSSQRTVGISTSPEGVTKSSTTKSASNYSTLSTIFEEKHTTKLEEKETTSSYESPKTEINEGLSTVPTPESEEEGSTNGSNSSSTKTENSYSTISSQITEGIATSPEGTITSLTTKSESNSTLSTTFEKIHTTQLGDDETTSSYKSSSTVPTFTLTEEEGASNKLSTETGNDYSTTSTKLEEKQTTLVEGETSVSKDPTTNIWEFSTTSTVTKNKPSTPLEEVTTSDFSRPATSILSTIESESSFSTPENSSVTDFTTQATENISTDSEASDSTKGSFSSSTLLESTKDKPKPTTYSTSKITSTTPSNEFVCSISGRFPDYTDTTCKRYFLCTQMPNGDFTKTLYYCPGISSFDPQLQKCTDSFICPRSTTKDPATTVTSSSTIGGKSSTFGYTTIIEDKTTASQEQELTSRFTTKDTATTDFGASSSTIEGESNSTASTSGYTTSSKDTTTALHEEQSTSTSTTEDTATTELGISSSTIRGESDSTASTWGTSGYTKTSEDTTSLKQSTPPNEESTYSSSNTPTMSTQLEDEVTTSYEEGSTATNTKTPTESFSSLSTQITNELSTLSDSSTTEPKTDYTKLSTNFEEQHTTTGSYEISTGSTGLEIETSTPNDEEGSSTKLEEELQTTSFEEESTSYNSSTAVTIEPSSTPEREVTSETVNEEETKETTLKTTEPPQQEFYCQQRGYFANELDSTCQTFHFCDVMGDGRIYGYTLQCPRSYLFNPSTNLCTTNHSCNQTRKIELNLSLNLPNIERNLTFVSYL